MNRLNIQKQAQIIACLVEGNSMRATSRMCDVSINTVTKLLIDVGTACAEYQDKTLRDLSCNKVQCDEIWCFCYAKEKNVPADKKGQFGYGDVYTWTAICADTKLAVSWLVGKRDALHAEVFMRDVASRLRNRITLSTDGHHVYLNAVENTFGSEVDYGMLIKEFGGQSKTDERRYSPAECTGTVKRRISGKPDMKDISTSFVERQNLTMRMGMRRFTRLTNGFSKKFDNLVHATSLHFMFYNFARIHKTLRITPAMKAGVTNHVWEIEEILKLAN